MIHNSQRLCSIGLVPKPQQSNFYVDNLLMDEFNKVLEAQGLSRSEGIVRLIRFTLDLPREMWPVIFLQAPGETPTIIAEHVLRQRQMPKLRAARPMGNPPPKH